MLRGMYKDSVYTYDVEEIKTWKSWKDIPTKEVRKLIALIHK
jgi:hypothetical protein